MTKKIYTTAQGKTVDLGAILLRNEHVRAVGNMNVNARGDLLDGSNRVIDPKNVQVARQMESTTQPAPTAVSTRPLHTSTVAARRNRDVAPVDPVAPAVDDPVEDTTVENTSPTDTAPIDSGPAPTGGLAAAMARSRTVTQERLKTQKEIAKNTPGVNKL
jgi:hypothetical protein